MNVAEIKQAIAWALKGAAHHCWDDLSGAGKFDRAKADRIAEQLYRELEPALRLEGPDIGADSDRIDLHPAGAEVTVRFPSGDLSPPIKASRIHTVEVGPSVKVLVLGLEPGVDKAVDLVVGVLQRTSGPLP